MVVASVLVILLLLANCHVVAHIVGRTLMAAYFVVLVNRFVLIELSPRSLETAANWIKQMLYNVIFHFHLNQYLACLINTNDVCT